MCPSRVCALERSRYAIGRNWAAIIDIGTRVCATPVQDRPVAGAAVDVALYRRLLQLTPLSL